MGQNRKDIFFLLKREIKEPVGPLILFAGISGMASAALIGIINTAAEYASNSEVNNKYFLLFFLGVVVVLISNKYVLDRSCAIVETVIYQLRYRIADKIRHTDLTTLEAMGTSPLYARLTQDSIVISNVSTILISHAQHTILIIFTVVYIGVISPISVFMLLLTIVLGGTLHFSYSNSFKETWKELSVKETAFFENLNNILQGFKEIKINRRKNEGVFESYVNVSSDLKNYRIRLIRSYNIVTVLSEAFLYILMGTILFILPHFHTEHSEDVIKIAAAVLFIIGPLEGLLNSKPLFDNANNSALNIIKLEEELEAELSKSNLSVETQNLPVTFETLPYLENVEFQDLSYSYPPTKERDHIFTVGPANLSFKKGELIFITGGNGSGKSTFLKLLTGLYLPESGRILLNTGGEKESTITVTPENAQQYRNLFTTIFPDFHLFGKLYGVVNPNKDVVNKILKNMELSEEKTSYKDGAFTSLKLSSGQKKRLALTTSIMEDKQIYIFDEVAADLDPGFRDVYYYELLRELKERNKTVIVVSHDRSYWAVPDRLLEMEDGSIRELTKEEIDSLIKQE